MVGYKYILIAFHLNFDLNGHEYIFIQSHSEATFYICCLHSKKPTKNPFIFYFCPQTCWASLFLSSFLPILQGLAILEFSPPSMAFYFFWFNIHCCFQIFISLLVTPFFHFCSRVLSFLSTILSLTLSTIFSPSPFLCFSLF